MEGEGFVFALSCLQIQVACFVSYASFDGMRPPAGEESYLSSSALAEMIDHQHH